MSPTPVLALAERLYRALLNLYPAGYRREYGALMVQVFRDMSRDVYHRRGLVGLIGWWCATLFDLIRTVIEQRREVVCSLPAAFLMNLLAMITKADSEQRTAFKLTPVHSILGLSLLFVVLMTFSDGVRYELRPFVTPLGSGALLGQILFLFGLLILPAAFLLLPRFAKASFGRLTFQPTSINLIIGAVILLVILMLVSGLLLETIACSGGVPNCD